MNDYQTLPGHTGVYLEDSFVLSIHDEGGTLSFDLDAVLTERHPRHTPPHPDEQYCYVSATLGFPHPDAVTWVRRTAATYHDAHGEIDHGNIDFLTIENDNTYRLGGDWGEVLVRSSSPPEFRIR